MTGISEIASGNGCVFYIGPCLGLKTKITKRKISVARAKILLISGTDQRRAVLSFAGSQKKWGGCLWEAGAPSHQVQWHLRTGAGAFLDECSAL